MPKFLIPSCYQQGRGQGHTLCSRNPLFPTNHVAREKSHLKMSETSWGKAWTSNTCRHSCVSFPGWSVGHTSARHSQGTHAKTKATQGKSWKIEHAHVGLQLWKLLLKRVSRKCRTSILQTIVAGDCVAVEVVFHLHNGSLHEGTAQENHCVGEWIRSSKCADAPWERALCLFRYAVKPVTVNMPIRRSLCLRWYAITLVCPFLRVTFLHS
jgi:hypothetical protein